MNNSHTLDGIHWSIDPEDGQADALEIFAGKTRLVESKRPSPSPPMQPATVGYHGLHLDTAGVYGAQDYNQPVISPPSAPPIPPLPAVGQVQDPSGAWYSQTQTQTTYTASYTPQAGPSGHRSDFGVPYDQVSPAGSYHSQQTWSQTHTQGSSPIHGQQQQQQQPQSAQPSHSHLQLPQLTQLPPYQGSRQQPSPHSQVSPHHPHHSQQYQLSPLHGGQYTDPTTGTQQQYRQHVPPTQVPSQHPHPQHQQHPTHPHHPQQAYIGDRTQPTPAQQIQNYPAAPAFQGVTDGYVPPQELVSLGLASRDNRLDERWANFMHESGYLDGNFRSN